MRQKSLAILFLFFLLGIAGIAAKKLPLLGRDAGPATVSSGINDFAELDHKGNLFELYRSTKISGAKALVILSIGIGCPIAENSLAKIQELNLKYGPQKIQFVLVNSNTQDSREAIVKSANDLNISLPILLDQSQIVADALSIDRTAEAIILDTSTFQVLYRGAIDDRMNYADHSAKAQHEFLADALDDILSGRQVRLIQTKTYGCAISRLNWPSPVTYYGQAAQVLINKCTICHNPHGARPQNLGSYQDARGWATMIKEVVETRRMPPENADAFYGGFLGDNALTPEEAGILVKWVNEGAQMGTARAIKYSLPNPSRRARKDYVLGPAIIQHPANSSKASSSVFLGRAPRDLWVTAEESYVISTQPIHHQKLVISATQLAPQDINGMQGNGIEESAAIRNIFLPTRNYFSFYHPPGLAKKIPGGSFIYLVQHLGLTTKEVSTNNTVYLQLGDPAQLAEIKRFFLLEVKGFTVPANSREFPMTWERRLDEDMEILSILPHMHKRGVKITVTLREPSGAEKIILSVPRLLYDWPRQYDFKKPIFAKAGAILKVSGLFDNSDTNPNHIDYSKPVESGWEQDTNEMLLFQVEYKLPKRSGSSKQVNPGN